MTYQGAHEALCLHIYVQRLTSLNPKVFKENLLMLAIHYRDHLINMRVYQLWLGCSTYKLKTH